MGSTITAAVTTVLWVGRVSRMVPSGKITVFGVSGTARFGGANILLNRGPQVAAAGALKLDLGSRLASEVDMAVLDRTHDRVGFLSKERPQCYILVRPTGQTKWGFSWIVELSDILQRRGESVDEVLTVVEHSGDLLLWIEQLEIEWAPNAEVAAAAAREIFPGSSLAKSTTGRPPQADYAPEWARFV